MSREGIFMNGLPPDITAYDLRNFFVRRNLPTENIQILGHGLKEAYAFIAFVTGSDAKLAVEQLDGRINLESPRPNTVEVVSEDRARELGALHFGAVAADPADRPPADAFEKAEAEKDANKRGWKKMPKDAYRYKKRAVGRIEMDEPEGGVQVAPGLVSLPKSMYLVAQKDPEVDDIADPWGEVNPVKRSPPPTPTHSKLSQIPAYALSEGYDPENGYPEEESSQSKKKRPISPRESTRAKRGRKKSFSFGRDVSALFGDNRPSGGEGFGSRDRSRAKSAKRPLMRSIMELSSGSIELKSEEHSPPPSAPCGPRADRNTSSGSRHYSQQRPPFEPRKSQQNLGKSERVGQTAGIEPVLTPSQHNRFDTASVTSEPFPPARTIFEATRAHIKLENAQSGHDDNDDDLYSVPRKDGAESLANSGEGRLSTLVDRAVRKQKTLAQAIESYVNGDAATVYSEPTVYEA